ncbi:MAG TPA: gliding motility lipoprotein GldH [Ferruginibacter sp.]|jgi:gliding motility-associated lipoprotein GldH|nr:gliding motility lipoprotein GldH [Ferruginibacter sp.]
MMKVRFLLLSITCCLFFCSCNKLDVFEKDTTIPQYEWSSTFQPSFDFDITDTASTYRLYIVLRHTDAYRYNNIWLNIGSKFPGDTMSYQKLELELGNDAAGWEGSGMDDIWEVRKPIAKGAFKTGKYTFSIAQIMRENPLPNIMSIGMRMEKMN